MENAEYKKIISEQKCTFLTENGTFQHPGSNPSKFSQFCVPY